MVIFPYDLDIYRQVNPKVWLYDLPKDTFSAPFETTNVITRPSRMNDDEDIPFVRSKEYKDTWGISKILHNVPFETPKLLQFIC